jgi:hypothetical protein
MGRKMDENKELMERKMEENKKILERNMEAMQFSHHIQAKNKATHKYTMGAYVGNTDHFGVYKTILPQPN